MKKGSIVILMIVFTALCALLFVLFYENAEKTAVRQLLDTQQLHAKQASQGIEEYFSTWTGILGSLAKIDSVIDVDENGKRHMKLFFETHRAQMRSMTRVDERGRIAYTVPYSSSIGSDISDQPHIRTILREHRPVVSDVFRTVQDFDGIALHVPVFQGAAFRGTIAIVMDFDSLAKRYLEVVKIGKTGYAWMVSRDGIILFTQVPEFVGKSIFEVSKDFPSMSAMARELVQGRTGTGVYTFNRIYEQVVKPVRKYAVYMPIRIADSYWTIVVASAEDEVLASLASFRNRLIPVIAVLFLGGILFSLLGAKAWFIVAEERNRKKAEEALRYSEQKFMKAFHATPDAIVISRAADGLLIEVNDVFLRIAGYDRAEIVGKTTTGLGVWANPADRERYVAGIREQGRVRDMEAQFCSKTGTVLDGLISGESILLDHEPCLLTIIRNITERKKTERELEQHRLHLEEMVNERTEELRRSQADLRRSLDETTAAKRCLEEANARLQELDRLKSLFIASMSHELRTPLNSIIGFTGILLQGLAGELNAEQRKQLGMVKSSSEHLLSLITDIIDLSKIEAGKVDLSLESFDLSAMVREVLSSFQIMAERKALSLSAEVPAGLMLVSDKRRTRQVLVNLVGNAVKFTEQGGVSVAAEHRDGVIHCTVRDTGMGIKPEDQGRLFKSFSQVTTTEAPKHEGTGLGLYLSRKLITLLGGEIGVESSFGRGSVFFFTIPANREEAA